MHHAKPKATEVVSVDVTVVLDSALLDVYRGIVKGHDSSGRLSAASLIALQISLDLYWKDEKISYFCPNWHSSTRSFFLKCEQISILSL